VGLKKRLDLPKKKKKLTECPLAAGRGTRGQKKTVPLSKEAASREGQRSGRKKRARRIENERSPYLGGIMESKHMRGDRRKITHSYCSKRGEKRKNSHNLGNRSHS